MKKLKILFFGGGIPSYKVGIKCLKLGATCYWADINNKCYASKERNFVNIDFNNRKKIIAFIKKKKINFIYITQSDVGIRSLGYVNSYLNLPGTKYNLAKNLTNKEIIRKILTKNNFFQPRFIVSLNIKKILNFISSRDFIVKPIDSSGSRGVLEIKKKLKLKNLIYDSLKFSKLKKIIVEEKIIGREFGAQTFSVNGKCNHVYLHNDYMSKKNRKIPIGHSMPFRMFKNKKIISRIKKEIARAVEVIGIKNGPANIDCIITKDHKLFILEISPRIGATCLPEILKVYSGVDWDLNAIKLFNGLKIDKFKENKINVIAKVFESNCSGTISKIKIEKKRGVKSNFFLRKNDRISKFTDGSKLFGFAISIGKNYKIIKKNVDEVINSIKITLNKVNQN